MFGLIEQINHQRALDTFSRPDSNVSMGSAETGQVWTAHEGTWGIISNKAYNAGNNGGKASVGCGVVDGYFQCDLYSDYYGTTGPHVPSIIFRLIDTLSFLMVTLYNNAVTLTKLESEVSTDLSTVAMTLVDGQTYVCRVEAVRENIKVYINNALKINYNLTGADATKFTANNCVRAGIRVGGVANLNLCRWDNFSVRRKI